MYKTEKERLLEYIQESINKINEIYTICEQCGGIYKALQSNNLIAQRAIMKTIDILYEQMCKFDKYNIIIKDDVYVKLSQSHIKEMQRIRIQSSHDYNSIEFDEIENFIVNDLAILKMELQNIIDNFDNFKIDVNNSAINSRKRDIRRNENKINTLMAINAEMEAEIKELEQNKNKSDIDESSSPDDDTPPPPSQGTKHKR